MKECNLRKEGLNHCYLDENQSLFSNVALGLLMRGVGHGLKVAYFNTKTNTFPLIEFFDKLYLNNLDFFSFSSLEMKFFSSYDLIIFDNFSFKSLTPIFIEELFECKSKNTEIVFVSNNEKDFEILSEKSDLVSKYIYSQKDSNDDVKDNICCISGDGKGKSTYSFGFVVRKLILGNFVKLVYFDKGGDFYGEKKIFDKIKLFHKNFQFYSFGEERFDGENFRFENSQDDIDEAKYALSELNRSSYKQIIVAEELNTCVGSGLLTEEKIISKLKEIDNNILITGRCSSSSLVDLSKKVIEVEEIKHYSKSGYGVRKGIDF